ncbi:F-box/kelch-repeat protein [Rhynchospora pubera]|uniref:F-box/kelch-repeat protein n=1 Tax=Rhynchospora pubera TaxID=906938 RepID=A0AAV8DTY6_9POAL|nr:F-box/kelch-repeat protein [Rhynchospora pubera]KAJ4789205.1 F-box/kelch-repeat protein [Rhynchospora pubera]
MDCPNLIPGLPHEIAQECLIRIPYDYFRSVRHVCRQWKQEVESAPFRSLRKETGMAQSVVISAQSEPSIVTAGEQNNTKSYTASGPIVYRLSLFHPDTGRWGLLPMIPGMPIGMPLFCQLATAGNKLVMLGGWNGETWAATDWVFVYDFTAGTWRQGAPIPGPRRSFFACAAFENLVFVAGGHDNDKNGLKSAMVYDVSSDTWTPLPDMSIERDEPKGFFLNGKFVVAGGYITAEQGRFRRSVQMFDPVNWTWDPVEENWLDEDVKAINSCVAVDGKVYKLKDGRYVAVREGDTWRIAAEVPADARMTTRLVTAGNNRLVVIGGGSHGVLPVAYVATEEAGKGMTWQRWDVPMEYWGHIQGICSMEL